MTESSLTCGVCDRDLGPEDLFCPRCGRPTPIYVDPDATILVGPGPDPDAPDPDGEVTLPVDISESGGRPSGTFRDRLRLVIGAEFEVISLLGEGGFARVYKARDRRLDRIVAIKVIQPDLVGSDLFVDSFRKEGIALANLRHPGIVPIYDIRERGGLIYHVMPFVRGATLEQRMSRGRLPPFEARRILSELTDALEAAHRAKIVHLDIKPDNVFLEGDLQKVLLVDFGIAMALTEKVPESSGGPIVGTPSYMSPEQAQGLPEIDHRSDIYSLGVLGYALLMGRPPFSGRTARDILKKHIEEAPVPIRDINPSIPKDFADAIMRCLEKNPWDRFSTAKELGGVLEAVTFFSTRGSRGSTAIPEPSSDTQRTTIAVIAAAALFIGLLLGMAIG